MRQDAAIGEDELHAWVDGQLPPERAAAVEGWLEEHPDEAERVGRWRVLNGRIRDAYGRDASVPGTLRPRAILARKRRRFGRLLAASLAMFLLGGVAGWIVGEVELSEPQPSVRLADEGIGAHKVYAVEVRHPVEVAAGERQHLQAWLSKRLDHSLTIPDLTAAGFQLVGGRLLANFDEPRAMFLYEAADGKRLTVYAGRNPLSREVAFRFHRSGEVGAICWLDPEMGYAVVAQADEPALLRLAHLVHQQM